MPRIAGRVDLNKRVRLMISGHVQGVWFRAAAKGQADRLGVFGWVRNRRAGQVEVLAEGDEAAIDLLIAWCRLGSRGARVARVDVAQETCCDEFDGFAIERTV